MKKRSIAIIAALSVITCIALLVNAYEVSNTPPPPQTPPVWIVNATINNATQIIAYVIGIYTIDRVTVDNIQQSVTPSSVDLSGEAQKIIVTGINTNWTDGASHKLIFHGPYGWDWGGTYVSNST